MTADLHVITGGGRPPASSIRVINFRREVRGPLRGFAGVAWDAAGLHFRDVPIFVDADGKGSCGLPGAPVLDSTGRHYTTADGKKRWRVVIEWRNRARGEAFSAAVIAALLKKYPDALDGEAA